MAKPRNKKAENLKKFLSHKSNAPLAGIGLALVAYSSWVSIMGLRSKISLLNCGNGVLRPYPYAPSLDTVHAESRLILYISGGLLVLLISFLIYRNKIAKAMLIGGIILFCIGYVMYSIGQGFQGIGCLSW